MPISPFLHQNMITVVSGLPRSGTSMMMKMLEAGGVPVLTDNIRTADEDNIKGYYEDERVKQLEENNRWVGEAEGKAVKVISFLLKQLPAEYQYRVVFMQRRIPEVLASQKKMMERRGEQMDDVPDEVMEKVYERHLDEVYQWLDQQPNIGVLYVSYNDALQDPEPHAEEITEFLGLDLDIEKMIQIVDPTLYRQRG